MKVEMMSGAVTSQGVQQRGAKLELPDHEAIELIETNKARAVRPKGSPAAEKATAEPDAEKAAAPKKRGGRKPKAK